MDEKITKFDCLVLNYNLMLEHQLRAVKDRIDGSCKRVGRNPEEIELVLVTKEVDFARIEEAYRLGVRDFGENRVQELVVKEQRLSRDIRWHFIGNLQTNKVKFLVDKIALVHSCDRLDLAKALQKQAEKLNAEVDVLIQVNTSGENAKHGFHPQRVEEAISEIRRLNRLKIRGLMTIGPNTEDRERIRDSFRLLRTLRDQLQHDFLSVDFHYLSMGMSSDFELAIEDRDVRDDAAEPRLGHHYARSPDRYSRATWRSS